MLFFFINTHVLKHISEWPHGIPVFASYLYLCLLYILEFKKQKISSHHIQGVGGMIFCGDVKSSSRSLLVINLSYPYY